MHCVIGSGPSGVACAQALLKRGFAVRMLDAGITLEPERLQAVEQLAAAQPADWDPRQLAFLKGSMSPDSKGVPQKLVYGSDFPYRGAEADVPCTFSGVGMKPSLALGGLSNVWGAAMLPYLDSDLAGWPFGAERLDAHYAEVLKLTGISGRRDDLESRFPLHAADPGELQLSNQARAMHDCMNRHKGALQRAGIHHGAARVAIRAPRAPDAAGCVYCGLCMYGCPYGYIYNSATTVNKLKQNPNFAYQGNTIVNSLAETPQGVTISAVDRISKGALVIEADRVFLAAGVVPTTRILLESQRDYGRKLWMKDSQYFLIPLLHLRRTPGVRHEHLQALSQLFVEIFDSKISPFAIHLQIYSYSELISSAIAQACGRFGLKFDFLVRQLEERLTVAQGFIHSDLSSKIGVRLEKGGNGAPSRLHLEAEINPETSATVKRVVSKLMRNGRRLGAIPLRPMLQIAEPGRGFHSGGTFPMRLQPAPFESDVLGRPHGWTRVHAVDATVLPSIPATTITLPVMANAHRIGSEAPH